ncbi:MAG TPA: AraC family transcriptional regulator [Cytophagaceae bacterium]
MRHVKHSDRGEQSFRVTQEVVPHFYNPLHFHNEVELAYIIQSHGTVFIGDYIGSFKPGDLFLIGEKLPHNFKNAADYFAKESKLEAEALVIHFDKDFLGADLWEKAEMKAINNLLHEARKGILVFGNTGSIVQKRMIDLPQLSSVSQVLAIVEMLDIISLSKENQVLSTSLPSSNFNFADAEKLNKINGYALMNFKKPIPIKTIAALVSMNPSAFCRYFKMRTKRSFSQFLIELRLQHATQMLINSSSTIDQISFESGFESPSYFYRCFRKHKGLTPAAFQKKLR